LQEARVSRIQRQALVALPAERMFALVHDVGDYPKRFDWCERAEVLEENADWLVARLDVRLGGVAASFTTRNTFAAPHSIGLELVEGPFRDLAGEWRFIKLGPGACRVELDLRFDFAGSLIGSALAIGFRRFADRLVEDFVRAARESP
jgi:ribosome-associated toxin RatA of RatAB toxin-antitoxin module